MNEWKEKFKKMSENFYNKNKESEMKDEIDQAGQIENLKKEVGVLRTEIPDLNKKIKSLDQSNMTKQTQLKKAEDEVNRYKD